MSIAAVSVAGHALMLSALLAAQPVAPTTPDPAPMMVALIDLPPSPVTPPSLSPASPAPAIAPPAPPRPKPVKPPPRRIAARAARAAPDIETLLDQAPVATTELGAQLSDAQIVGAASAEGGSSGRACDMLGWVQAALRKDPLVQSEVSSAAGKAIMVWNGDWVKNNGEDGKGLAAVREAILWEVAFAPRACRSEPVHGLVLVSLKQPLVRLALGAGQWRWSDLLTAHASFSDRGSE